MSYKSQPYIFNTINVGGDSIIKGDVAPDDVSKMWLDTSQEPYILKYHNGTGWVMANDQTEDIEATKQEITEEYKSAITVTADSISQTVTAIEERVLANETSVNKLSMDITTEAGKITALQREDIEIKDALTGKVDTISLEKWIRWDGEQMEMGASTDDFKVLLSRIKLAFLEAGVETTWLSNQELWANFVQAKNRISVGEGDGKDGNDERLSLVDEGDLGYSLM